MALLAFLSDASALCIGLGALVVAYVVFAPSRNASPPDSNVRHPRRMALTLPALVRIARLLRYPEELPNLVLRAALEFGEQPWLRHVPFLADVLMISSPALIEDVVKTQQAIFVKSKLLRDITAETVGDAFFSLEGRAWFHQRKIASRFFSPRVYRDVATLKIQKHIEKLETVLKDAASTRVPVNLTRLLFGFTFQAFADLGFGLQTDALNQNTPHALEDAIDKAFSQSIYRVVVPPWFWKLQRFLYFGSERAYAETTTEIRRIVNGLVRESIELSQQKSDDQVETLVEVFVNAMRDNELPFSPELLCDLSVMFMIAGRDTTAGTLVWILYALGKYPDVADKIRVEMVEKLPQFMDNSEPSLTMDDVQKLTYMEAVIKETMRLYPVLPVTLREAAQDAVLADGTFVAKDTIVGLSPYVTGRLPSVWGGDVLEFKPERFLDPSTGKLRSVSAFQLFGFLAGPRICIGMTLAMLEMKLVLAHVLGRFRFDMAPNDGSYSVSALMVLKHPLVARVAVDDRAPAF